MDLINIWSSIILGVFGLIITFIYSSKAKKLQDDLLMKQLFEKFNERYDLINDHLNKIVVSEVTNVKDLQIHFVEINGVKKSFLHVLIDYFNLCAEEYFWYKRERINSEIWTSWNTGMKYWYKSSKLIRDLWTKEISDNGYHCYYLKNNDDFFTSN